MRPGALATTVAGAALLGAVLTGCSATSTGAGESSPPATAGTSTAPVPTTPTQVTQTDAPTTSSEAPSTAASASPTQAPPSSSSTSPRPVPRSTCTKLTIRVLVGSAAPGYEFAALQFVNGGSKRCTLAGVPTVTLFRGGARVGTVSQPSEPSAVYSTYQLAPGATAESRLKDFSNCNAPLSDTIEVVAPGSNISTTRPGQLRACRLRVYPLTAPE